MKKLIYIICLSFLSACTDIMYEESYPFLVVNNAPHAIGIYPAWGPVYGEKVPRTAYPDTTLPIDDRYIIRWKDFKNGKQMNLAPTQSWEEMFEKLPADTLSFFVFHEDTLQKYSWQEVRDGYKVLKRYDLSLEDLKRMNYTITYP